MALIAPELAADVTSLSRLEESLDYLPRTYVGRVRFELDLPLLMAVGIEFLGLAVSVGAWYSGVAPVLAGGAAPPKF